MVNGSILLDKLNSVKFYRYFWAISTQLWWPNGYYHVWTLCAGSREYGQCGNFKV